MKKIIFSTIILAFLISISSVSAIDSFACVPSLVPQGGTMECEADLAGGTTEKNVEYNVTFYNDTAQTVIINSCTFSGTTENSPNPIDVIQGCDIPSDYGSSTTAVVNFTIIGGDTKIFQFNISETSSITLTISNFAFETPILMGKLIGARWTVTKQDTGKAVLGAKCTGDLLQLEGGNLVPIAGSTGGFSTLLSKFAGHALTSFTPTVNILEEGSSYIVEVRCDCIPENGGCINEDGSVLINANSSSGLIGIGTSSIEIGTWLTSNTVTDKLNYEVGETVIVCANITNPENRKRIGVSIEYNLRCDSGSSSDRNRILLERHREIRGIDGNKTEMQCHDFKIPDVETLEKGATRCKGATDVTVLDELLNPLVTYSTISPNFNITTNRIHPEIFWERVSRTVYFANVSTDIFDVGVKNVQITINQLMHEQDTHATAIKSFTVTYINGSAIPFETVISIHERFIRTSEEDEGIRDFDVVTIEIKGVNTTLDDNFNITIEFVDFQNRQATALEGIENKTGTFHFDVECPPTTPIGEEMDCAITAFIEETQLVQKEVDFTCWIEVGEDRISESNFNQMITRESQTFNRKFMVLGDLAENQQYVLQCEAGYYNFGSRTDSFFDTFLVTDNQQGNGTIIGLPQVKEVRELIDDIKEKIDEIIPGDLPTYMNLIIAVVISIFIIFIIILIVGLVKRRKKDSD